MTALSVDQIYAYALGAGFTPDQARTATAIALAESGGDPTSVGDINNPGPGARSVGLWQINYLPSRDWHNPVRDPVANLDPAKNAAAAYRISRGGTNWDAWTTYRNGTATSLLSRVDAALSGAPSKALDAVHTTSASLAGTVGGLLANVFGLDDARRQVATVALTTLFAAGGVALVVLGLVKAVEPAVQKVAEVGAATGKVAAA